MNKFEKNNEGPQGTRVIVTNNDFGKALRRFKKKIAEEGILQELRQREYYESKGTKRRKAKEAAIRRFNRQRIKDQDL